MARPLKTQPAPDIPKKYGITDSVSEDLPEEADLIQTTKLMETLKSYDVFEDELQLQHREKVLKHLESLYEDWLKEISEEMNISEFVSENIGGRIIPFGSYHLGVHSKGADIDVLCVGPGYLERNDFFTSFYEKLKAQEEVKNIQAINKAFVPVIKLSYDGTEIDLIFARVPLKCIPKNLDLLDDKVLENIDKHCARSFNGYRVTEEILRLVPNVYNFRLALRAIKLWAKQRNIYSNKLGFLGGISWAILVAKICQLYPNATVSTLVIKFFKVYSMWEWPIPIRLRIVEDCHYNLPFWDPRINPSDRCHLMPIITPAYPQQNTSFNVSPSTLAIIQEEIERGHVIAQEIEKTNANWSKLFETPDFFEKYQHYVLLQATSATEEKHVEWVGLVESKIRLLVGILEKNENVSLAHVNLQPFTGPKNANNQDGLSTMWLIGLLFNTEASKNHQIDLTSDLCSITHTIYSQAQSCETYEEGMTISATCVKRENLSWAMPNGEHKKVFNAKLMPAWSSHVSASVPPCHTPPVSAGRPDSKTRGWCKSHIADKSTSRKLRYDRRSLLELQPSSKFGTVDAITMECLDSLGLLRQKYTATHEAARLPTKTGRHKKRHKWRHRKQKCGCQEGLTARLNANPCRTPLPSILVANVRSLETKLDYLQLDLSTRRELRDCCVIILTETWLNASVPDVAVSLEGLTVFRLDRSCELTDKSHGGGVCIYTNNCWCNNSTVVSSHCSPDIEFLTVKCRPFYLPREFTTVCITAVYIPHSANTKEALSILCHSISDLQNAHPEGVFIVAGDFNQANMKTVLPHFHQYVDFATRGENTLDLAYSNIKEAFKAVPRPHLSSLDHLSIMLIPAYRPMVIREKPSVEQVRVWPEGAMDALQDCFESTDWGMFRAAATHNQHINMDKYASSVSGYVQKCIEDVSVIKDITTRANHKPQLNTEAVSRQPPLHQCQRNPQ